MADAMGTTPGRIPGADTSVSGSTQFHTLPYVEWSAIFAGAVVAMAVSFVLLAFGSAVGLSAVSPWTSTRTSVTAVSLGAGFWMILVAVWSFALGGYLAGRMRHRHSGASASEVNFRDGTHGAVVWAVSVTIGAIIAALSAASIVGSGIEAGANAARGAGADPVSAATDSLLRVNTANPNARTEDVRPEIARLLARAAASPADMSAADRTYLNGLVAARAGIAPADAERRVNEAVTTMRQAVERARKVAVVVGFISAATLLLGAAAAWWGATMGGQHRDEGTIWHGLAARSSLAQWRRGVVP